MTFNIVTDNDVAVVSAHSPPPISLAPGGEQGGFPCATWRHDSGWRRQYWDWWSARWGGQVPTLPLPRPPSTPDSGCRRSPRGSPPPTVADRKGSSSRRGAVSSSPTAPATCAYSQPTPTTRTRRRPP